jgi:hypothetical protein
VLNARDDDALRDLLPFKYRQGASDEAPAVVGAEEVKNVLVFDEHYVAQFVFQPDEVVKNSFEIFINTPEYQEGIEELEGIFEDLKKLFLENEALDEVIASFSELRNAFTVTRSGGIAKTSKGFKALNMGGKLTTIPKPLRGYEQFLRSDDPGGWLSWQAKGKSYLELSDTACGVRKLELAPTRRPIGRLAPRDHREFLAGTLLPVTVMVMRPDQGSRTRHFKTTLDRGT